MKCREIQDCCHCGYSYILMCAYFGLYMFSDMGNQLPYAGWVWSHYIHLFHLIYCFYNTLLSCLYNNMLYYFHNCILPLIPRCLVQAYSNCETFMQRMTWSNHFLLQVCATLLVTWWEAKGMHRRPTLHKLCIICQKDTKQKVTKVSSDSLQSVDSTRQFRLKLQSDKFWYPTAGLTKILQTDSYQLFTWHTDCRFA